MPLSGTVVRYDPGGNGAHGVAVASLRSGVVESIVSRTLGTAEKVLEIVETTENLIGLGVDTLSFWGTGPSGWRPADLWLRHRYPSVQNSVVSPNGLFGSMGLNGMAVLVASRYLHPDLSITETHPKVLFWALTAERYDFANRKAFMVGTLCEWMGAALHPDNEHERDAAISAYAALKGLLGEWCHDLHTLLEGPGTRLVSPCGVTHYWWPEA